MEKEIENRSFLVSYDTVIQPNRFHSRSLWNTRCEIQMRSRQLFQVPFPSLYCSGMTSVVPALCSPMSKFCFRKKNSHDDTLYLLFNLLTVLRVTKQQSDAT